MFQGIALRGLFIIDKEGVIQHSTINNLAIGRSVDETLRTLQVNISWTEVHLYMPHCRFISSLYAKHESNYGWKLFSMFALQALQYVQENPDEVCPAGWKPGDKSMKPDPKLSKEYFAAIWILSDCQTRELWIVNCDPELISLEIEGSFSPLGGGVL